MIEGLLLYLRYIDCKFNIENNLKISDFLQIKDGQQDPYWDFIIFGK